MKLHMVTWNSVKLFVVTYGHCVPERFSADKKTAQVLCQNNCLNPLRMKPGESLRAPFPGIWLLGLMTCKCLSPVTSILRHLEIPRSPSSKFPTHKNCLGPRLFPFV